MVETITPVVHGSRKRWSVAVAAHTIGAAASAALFGAVLGALGGVLGAPWGAGGPLLVAMLAAAYGVAELAGRALPVPQARRQVPEWWRTFFGPIPAAALYGAGLGIGFLTYLSSGALVAASAAALASGRPLLGAVVVGAFGVARGASIIVVGRARSSEDVARVAEHVASVGASRVPRLSTGVALVVLAAMALRASVGQRVDPAGFAAAVVVLTMGWAAVAKIVRPGLWRESVRAYALGPLAGPAIIAVPIAELAVVSLGLAHERRAAAVVCLVLLTCFSAAAVRARIRTGAAVPCGCFGVARTRPLHVLLLRNAALVAVAGVGLAGSHGRTSRALALPTGEIAPLALLVAGAAAVTLLAARVRALVQGQG